MKYHHAGIPTQSPRDGESYLADFDIHATDHEANSFGIQWMRYGRDCRLPRIVQEVAHVAFEVDDLNRALQGRQVLIPPNSPSKGVTVAFILENGAPVELLQFDHD